MAHQGWDTLTIDLQHGVVDYRAMVGMLQAISTTATVPIVRVPWLEPGIIAKTLDAGAYGVICPMVNTREEAQRFVAYTSYAPKGTRSFGPVRALLLRRRGSPDAKRTTPSCASAMIETAQALDNLDAILSVEGLDAIYIGPRICRWRWAASRQFDDVEPKVRGHRPPSRAPRRMAWWPASTTAAATSPRRASLRGFRFVTVSSTHA